MGKILCSSNKTSLKKTTEKPVRIEKRRSTEYFADKRVFQRDQKGQKDTNSMFAAMVTRYVS